MHGHWGGYQTRLLAYKFILVMTEDLQDFQICRTVFRKRVLGGRGREARALLWVRSDKWPPARRCRARGRRGPRERPGPGVAPTSRSPRGSATNIPEGLCPGSCKFSGPVREATTRGVGGKYERLDRWVARRGPIDVSLIYLSARFEIRKGDSSKERGGFIEQSARRCRDRQQAGIY